MKRCNENDVTHLLSINTNPKDFETHMDLIKDFNNIYISYGIHPEGINNETILSYKEIEKIIENPKLIALGETGLDFYHSIKYKNKQIEVFEAHIEASKIYDLPLIIHQRDSEDEIINVLNKFKDDNLKIVFHCFTGTSKLKNFCLDNDYYISISGIITFKNANNLRENIKDIPLTSILIETDSPFLSPVPLRGKQNEPSYVKYIGKYLSDFFSIPINELIKITDDNFYKLFSKAIRYNELFL